MSSIDPLKFVRRLRRRKRLEEWLQHQQKKKKTADKPYPEPSSRPKDVPPQPQQQQTSDRQNQRLQGRGRGRQQPSQDRIPGQIGGREDLRASRRRYWRKVNSVSAIR